MSLGLTVNQRLRLAIINYDKFSSSNTLPPTSKEYQQVLADLKDEFLLILRMIASLDLFSANESLEEMSASYIPFLALDFYIGSIEAMLETLSNFEDRGLKASDKLKHLAKARGLLVKFLETVSVYESMLSPGEVETLDMIKMHNGERVETRNAFPQNSYQRRDAKITAYKRKRRLEEMIQNCDLQAIVIDKSSTTTTEDDLRDIYINELRLLVLKALDILEAITLESQVLLTSKELPMEFSDPHARGVKSDFTLRVEEVPGKRKSVQELIGKNGKILRPFTITKSREDSKKAVFGTGQILPSMSVDEYLEYELLHGKLLKANDHQVDLESDGSEAELEARAWDDWKDDNPKGSGNMKANIG